jgi:site-specific recombinase XerD
MYGRFIQKQYSTLLAEIDFDRRLDEACEGLQPYIKTHLKERVSKENAFVIVEYAHSIKVEVNPSKGYKESIMDTIVQLAKTHRNKTFREMTRDDILTFLSRLEKSEEEDRKHRWIGTYNQNLINIRRFYKWLYYP